MTFREDHHRDDIVRQRAGARGIPCRGCPSRKPARSRGISRLENIQVLQRLGELHQPEAMLERAQSLTDKARSATGRRVIIVRHVVPDRIQRPAYPDQFVAFEYPSGAWKNTAWLTCAG